MRIVLFGAEADELRSVVARHPLLEIVEADPEAIVCYGGDGTLLTAERRWPGTPKVPIRNSQRGKRCIAHPPEQVIERLAVGGLAQTAYLKLGCLIRHAGQTEPGLYLSAMNEFNVHMGRINSAVRFRMWLNDEPYAEGREILGDGLVVSTPFGSTAYFSHITRGVFHTGIGVAFQNTTEHTNHVIVPEETAIRVVITRGPAQLAHDNAPECLSLEEGHELAVMRHSEPAIMLTWESMVYQSDEF